jgi:malonate decarboxylase beta subunit
MASNSFIELTARKRAQVLLDTGSARELLGPWDRMESPWLAPQNITPQSDDGCVVCKGQIGGRAVVAIAVEAAFQGGAVGEVSGAKICAALDLAARDSERGQRTSAVLAIETGGVRLQEANLGLASIAEIQASVLALRQYAPVVFVIAGPVGCFGGMSIVAGLASYIVMTREGRLGLNGPEVIEEEAGVEEFDASDRALIWAINGGEQRYAMGLVDALVRDDAAEIAATVAGLIAQGLPLKTRSQQAAWVRNRINLLDPSLAWSPTAVRQVWASGEPI